MNLTGPIVNVTSSKNVGLLLKLNTEDDIFCKSLFILPGGHVQVEEAWRKRSYCPKKQHGPSYDKWSTVCQYEQCFAKKLKPQIINENRIFSIIEINEVPKWTYQTEKEAKRIADENYQKDLSEFNAQPWHKKIGGFQPRTT